MKQIITLIIVLFFTQHLAAQESCNCPQELSFVYTQMQSMASFKSQVKGAEKKAFEKTYQAIREKINENTSKVECFWQMNQLMSFVKDEHASIYETSPDYTVEDIYDSAFIQRYQKSEVFKNFPKATVDLASLRTDLMGKEIDDIEGIYAMGQDVMEIGVYRKASQDSLLAVVLNSKIGIWEAGQVFAFIKEVEALEGIYDVITFSQVYKNLRFMNNRWVRNGILFSNVKKPLSTKDYGIPALEASDAYQLKRLNDEVQYIWIDNFSRIGNAQRRDQLIRQIEEELTSDYLIFDLRNNPGGASKISKPILKAIDKHSDAKVYVLTNYGSGSNAEQTTVRLKAKKGTVHLGERTRGAIAYGTNYGTSYASPSGMFRILPTDMKFNKWLSYEEVGVVPDIELTQDTDWIKQTLDIIERQKNL